MPSHPVMAGHRPNRHHPGVPDETTGEPASQAGLELGVVLKVAFPMRVCMWGCGSAGGDGSPVPLHDPPLGGGGFNCECLTTGCPLGVVAL